MSDHDGEVVRAAGCVVWRAVRGGGIEVLVAHRPRYDDWSLPKGKLEAGEDHVTAAEREVLEEVGTTGELGPELASTRYVDPEGRPKVVRYWALRADGGRFTPNDEVDQVRWLAPDDAGRTMTYDRERDVLRSFLATAG